jgi:hypothetical protein
MKLIPFSCRFGHTPFDVSAESEYESGQQRSKLRSQSESKPPNHRSPKGDFEMRFMVIVKATPETEKEGALPDP